MLVLSPHERKNHTDRKSALTRFMMNLDNRIDWLSRRQALDLLGISEAQLRKDQAVLNELEPNQWNYQPHDKGFDRDSLRVLWEFRQLVKRGRRIAIQNINHVMERTQDEQ